MRAPVPVARLADLAMILPGPRQGLRRLLEGEARTAGIDLRVSVEADALQMLKDLVLRGLGFTVLPFAVVRAELQAGSLCAAPIAEPVLTRRLVLARSLVPPASTPVGRFAAPPQTYTTHTAPPRLRPGQTQPR